MRNYWELKYGKILRTLLRFRNIFEASNNISNIFNLTIYKSMTLKAWDPRTVWNYTISVHCSKF
jgi:hypothetical protein